MQFCFFGATLSTWKNMWKVCVQQLYLCPTYFEVIIKAKVLLVQTIAPIQVLHLKPLRLAQSFNYVIVPKFHQNRLFKSKELLTTTIDIDMMVDNYKLQDWSNVYQPNLWLTSYFTCMPKSIPNEFFSMCCHCFRLPLYEFFKIHLQLGHILLLLCFG